MKVCVGSNQTVDNSRFSRPRTTSQNKHLALERFFDSIFLYIVVRNAESFLNVSDFFLQVII